jgi:hypothetical protein
VPLVSIIESFSGPAGLLDTSSVEVLFITKRSSAFRILYVAIIPI